MLHKIIALAVLIFCASLTTRAQRAVNHAVQANIIYRFTKYIDWPNDKKSGEFVIGVMEDEDLLAELAKLTRNKYVSNQPIRVKSYTADDQFSCHILFISENNSSALRKIAKATSGKPILLISEQNGLIYKGSCINFVIVEDRIKLEFSKANIYARSLSIASELLSLGEIIN